MLVLTRKTGESICIGDEVEVRVVGVRGQKVRLAIEAPREIAVRRTELRADAHPIGRALRLREELLEDHRRRAVS